MTKTTQQFTDDPVSDLVRHLSQPSRVMLLFMLYKEVLREEYSEWQRGKRYEQLEPFKRLAQQLGVSSSSLDEYIDGDAPIRDEVALRGFNLIERRQQPFYVIQELGAILVHLARVYPEYRSPHEFEIRWRIPDTAEHDVAGVPLQGKLKIRYEFDSVLLEDENAKAGARVGIDYLVFRPKDVDHPRVRRMRQYHPEKEISVFKRGLKLDSIGEIGERQEGAAAT